MSNKTISDFLELKKVNESLTKALLDKTKIIEDLIERNRELDAKLKDFEYMVDWMESNSNSSLCDFYNRD